MRPATKGRTPWNFATRPAPAAAKFCAARNRRTFLAAAGGSALGLSSARFAHAAEDVLQLPYESVPDPLRLPPDLYLGEVSGVAPNSKGHIFVLHRGNTTGPAYSAAAAQLLEFDAVGNYLREIGHNFFTCLVLRPHGEGRS